MSVCILCGADPDESVVIEPGVRVSGHACHCVRDDGVRVAVGICCGHMLGAGTLADEDSADAAYRAKYTPEEREARRRRVNSKGKP